MDNYNNKFKEKKKTILLLGGSSDIAFETINKFVSNGWQVIAHYNSNYKIFNKLRNNNLKNIILIKADFTKKNSMKNFLSKIKKFNISSFINLVGYIDNLTFNNTNLNNLIKSLQANSLIPILIQKSFLTKMKKEKFGRILHISSIGVKYGGGYNNFNYSFSKHALEFIPTHLRNLVKYNILTNILRVGVVKTKLHKKINKKNMKKRIKLIPMKRAANIEEISDLIFFLASEKNSYISNETISIAGGE